MDIFHDVLSLVVRRVGEYSEPYTPCDSGELVNSISYTDDSIIYNTDYAKSVYFGDQNLKHDKHPLSSHKWVRVGYNANKDVLFSEVKQEVIKKLKESLIND